MIATIDLQKTTTISSIALGAIQNWGKWIFLPQWVQFEVSEDGINYKEIKTIQNTISPTEKNELLKDFKAEFSPQSVRYIRVTAKNLEKCPLGHPAENQACWLFVDEIMIE
jgi:hexosaminidase